MTAKKRVAIFIPTLSGGGAEISMVALANGLAARGYAVDFLVKQNRGEISSTVNKNVNIVNFDVPIMRYTFGKLVAYLRKYRPCTLISALELPNSTAVLAKMVVAHKPRTIISIRGIISKQKPIYHKLLDRLIFQTLYRRADTVVCVSHASAKDAINYLHLRETKTKVIYNPVIDSNFYERVAETAVFDWLPSAERKVVITVGRLEPVKDHKTLLRAFKRVREYEDAVLIILGEGSLRSELIEMAEKLGIGQDVIMPGFIPKPYSILSRSNVFVLSSLHESFANVVIESLACNCPVVSTACGGPEEILDDGKYGQLVSVGDDQAMAQAILNVLSGDHRLAPAQWLQQFTAEQNIDAYIQLIEAG